MGQGAPKQMAPAKQEPAPHGREHDSHDKENHHSAWGLEELEDDIEDDDEKNPFTGPSIVRYQAKKPPKDPSEPLDNSGLSPGPNQTAEKVDKSRFQNHTINHYVVSRQTPTVSETVAIEVEEDQGPRLPVFTGPIMKRNGVTRQASEIAADAVESALNGDDLDDELEEICDNEEVTDRTVIRGERKPYDPSRARNRIYPKTECSFIDWQAQSKGPGKENDANERVDTKGVFQAYTFSANKLGAISGEGGLDVNHAILSGRPSPPRPSVARDGYARHVETMRRINAGSPTTHSPGSNSRNFEVTEDCLLDADEADIAAEALTITRVAYPSAAKLRGKGQT